MISDCHLALHSFDDRIIANERVFQNRFGDLRVRSYYRVTDAGAIQHGSRPDRDVRPDPRLLESDVVLDIDGIDDRGITHILRTTRAAALEHRLVGLDHRLDFSGVVPAFDIDDFDLRALLDHV